MSIAAEITSDYRQHRIDLLKARIYFWDAINPNDDDYAWETLGIIGDVSYMSKINALADIDVPKKLTDTHFPLSEINHCLECFDGKFITQLLPDDTARINHNMYLRYENLFQQIADYKFIVDTAEACGIECAEFRQKQISAAEALIASLFDVVHAYLHKSRECDEDVAMTDFCHLLLECGKRLQD